MRIQRNIARVRKITNPYLPCTYQTGEHMSEPASGDERTLVGVDWDEWYPVFYLTEDDPQKSALFTPAEIERIEAAKMEYDSVQNLIAARIGWGSASFYAPSEQENIID
jgi:hypothetical protein